MQIITKDQADEAILERWARLQCDVYADDRRRIPTTDDERRSALNRPKFDGSRHIVQAVDGSRPRAQAVARLSPELTDGADRPVGFIGDFESRRDSAAAAAVLRDAARWLREAGAETVLGPVDGDIWQGYRFNLGPWEVEPCLLEPYNPDFYPLLWRNSGFALQQTFATQYGTNLDGAARVLEPKFERARAAGYRFESFDPERFDREVERLWRLTHRVLRDKPLFTEISIDRFREQFDGLGAILDEELVWFVRDSEGCDAGFVFGLPNYHRPVEAMKRRSGWTGRLAFAWHGRPETAALHTIGVVPEHRGNHLSYALAHRLYERAAARGFDGMYGLLIDEGNRSSRLSAGLGETVRRYGLYRLAERPGSL